VDLDFLQKLAQDPGMLSRYAWRFGVDEQTLAERAALFLRERRWERLAEMPPEELKKILTDESLLKKYAGEFGVDVDRLRAFIEDALQARMGVKAPAPEKPPAEPRSMPEKPIERAGPGKEHQFKPPETEVEARGGQVLIVRAKEEELKPLIRRLEELPTVQARPRALLMHRRGRGEAELQRPRGDEVEQTPGKVRDEAVFDRTTPNRAADEAPDRTPVTTPDRTTDVTPVKTTDRTVEREVQRVAEREVLVLDRDALRLIVPALPASVFAMPVAVVLPMISRIAGMPVALAPGIPRPSPRESFGAWLDRVFAGTGFNWRALAMQKETFVFA
jgi:hypothetical protein